MLAFAMRTVVGPVELPVASTSSVHSPLQLAALSSVRSAVEAGPIALGSHKFPGPSSLCCSMQLLIILVEE